MTLLTCNSAYESLVISVMVLKKLSLLYKLPIFLPGVKLSACKGYQLTNNYLMEPRYNGVPRDWQNLFAIARFVSIYYAITGVNKIVLYAEDFVMGEGSSFINIQKVFKIISLALKCCLSDVIKVLLKGFSAKLFSPLLTLLLLVL